MTIIRRVVSAARPTVNTFFETLSTKLTNIVDTILGKSSEGEDKSLLAILLAPAALHRQQAHFHRHGELITHIVSRTRLGVPVDAHRPGSRWAYNLAVAGDSPRSRTR